MTILTVGFGDFYPTSDAGRGLVFPYSVGIGLLKVGTPLIADRSAVS